MGFALSDMQVTSAAFEDGKAIPKKHSGEGEDVSPALFWKNAPQGTRSFAVFVHDPDAPLVENRGTYGFTHWVCYNIPPDVNRLQEDCKEYAQGKNNMDNARYNGPMPPEGHGVHRYYFWVLALDLEPSLQDNMGLSEFLSKVEPHVIGMNRLVGTYER